MPLLEANGVVVRFGGLQALSDVDLAVEAGSITGLIGPNGAGKTTMFNVISGLQATAAGRVRFDEKDVSGLKPHDRSRLGIARTFQRLEVFGSMTARENILVAAEIRKRWSGDKDNPGQIADEVLERLKLQDVAHERVDSMPTGLARMVELARAMATKPRLMLLDEPSSGLDEQESEHFANILFQLRKAGLGLLLVEHDVELVMRCCDTIHVLDFGRLIAVGPPSKIQKDPAVQAAYLGAERESA